MAGTQPGGKLAARINRQRYGADFYRRIGAIGGSKSRGGGFGSQERGPDGLTGKERAKVAGAKGGRLSRRTGVPNGRKAGVEVV